MISKASYVACDGCGTPAQVVIEGYQEARAAARREGFVYIDGKDLCPLCRPEDLDPSESVE